jgi:hypothetical protein
MHGGFDHHDGNWPSHQLIVTGHHLTFAPCERFLKVW